MSKSKCCGWRDPKITRQGDILMIADRKSSIPRPYCMTCGRSCEIIPESAVDTAPASDATEGTGETSPPKPSKPIELERLSEILFDNFYGHGLSKEIETAKAKVLEWVKSLVPEKKIPENTPNEAYRGMIGGYNQCIDDILSILESERQ